ncbi:helix-turn-helix transcriptional regulator [Marinomonas fungiae]|uniref:Predicted DNA-binding transcriptional regulator YafY, contains an HTH and WYL domains n=1 Tax=Marinomonas fungiae TaxID=1137284 RepID=A0A0K6IV45_9GAMM|nr:WYL domain-containing protein [Marinomonas fungiae]CUB06980.1 Predicted DNA-binding transcriptional regulator YafY, contains an HTH and WYL domains [Marinomonas fungiae]
MGAKHDTLFRTLAMLQIIPKEPRYKATSTIHAALEEKGFQVSLRTIQRDLSSMSSHLPLICHEGDGEHRWSLSSSFNDSRLGLDTPTALTLVLAHEYLSGLLPQIAVDQISSQFKAAQQYLSALPSNHYSGWANRVKAIPNGKTLIPAQIKEGIWEAVSEAVLEEYAIEVMYLSRKHNEPKSYALHPQAIVVRHSVSYLLAIVKDYDDILQFALHRIQKVERSDKQFRPLKGFDLTDYIEQGGFNYRQSSGPTVLKARVRVEIAWLLSETPLSEDQNLKPEEDGWFQLTATVPDDQQTLWWIQGYGAAIDVYEPQAWREHIHQQAREVLGLN